MLPSTDYRLTELCVEDLNEVIRIEHAASDFPWRVAHFEDALRHGCTGVCIRHARGALCGYCLWMQVVDEVQVLNLCVASEMQKQGLGYALLSHVIQSARAVGGTSLLLEVGQSNPRALRLYRRLGFTEIGCRKNYYMNAKGLREAAHVMRLTLPERHDGAA